MHVLTAYELDAFPYSSGSGGEVGEDEMRIKNFYNIKKRIVLSVFLLF